ncbi:MAG: BTAD domain-containing putative transcriptional regulator [Anaerosomatales bacterium]|nr:BTAD domain-containing putative transcriptional regulator [Anaerosomatales bacterium]
MKIVASALRERTNPRSMLVVTARDISLWSHDADFRGVAILEKESLALSLSEAYEVAKRRSVRILPKEVVRRCHSLSRGQVALFSLLVRYPDTLATSELLNRRPAVALRRCIQSLIVDVLTPEQREILSVAAILSCGLIDDLHACLPDGTVNAEMVADLQDAFPLFRVVGQRRNEFRVHDLVLDAYADGSSELILRKDSQSVCLALRILASRHRFHRLLSVCVVMNWDDQLFEALEKHGQTYFLEGGSSELIHFLGHLSANRRAGSSRLLLLQGRCLEHLGQYEEALAAVRLAQRVAAVQADDEIETDALAAEMIMLASQGRIGGASEVADRIQSRSQCEASRTKIDVLKCWNLVRLVDEADARQVDLEVQRVLSLALEVGLQEEVACRSVSMAGVVSNYALGDMNRARWAFHALARYSKCGELMRLLGEGNLIEIAAMTGRLTEARAHAKQALPVAQRLSKDLMTAWRHSLALVEAGEGNYEASIASHGKCLESHLDCDFATMESGVTRLTFSEVLRAAGLLESSLVEAEESTLLFQQCGMGWRQFRFHAHTERLASRLALGDEELVYNEGVELRKELEGTGYSFYLLRLDMVLAEIERRRGEIDRAASRIAEHADHIRGEGSNWHMAMYTRAFPGLLGVFARALGPDGIPIHMLRMLLEPCATRSLELARSLLDDADWRRLVLRTLGKAKGAAFLQAHEGPPVLRVRLFGGLQVEGPNGVVPDKAWGKRKARLLFAMLAMNRGRDVPRDVLFERLWPDMRVDKAQSNFYVTWSYMKKALAPDGGPCPYLEHRGGVCRIVPEAVHTDLAEFLEAAGALRKAKARSDADAVISAAERMAELHSGELLAGDLYEDWCEDARVHARHELSDAMLAGAEALAERGAPERAVRLVRHALAFDPWREDLYQAALRYQIMAGQRSSAIETYMTCRTKLAEDLGLDPSQETQRLYEQVLAMEDVEESAVPA